MSVGDITPTSTATAVEYEEEQAGGRMGDIILLVGADVDAEVHASPNLRLLSIEEENMGVLPLSLLRRGACRVFLWGE